MYYQLSLGVVRVRVFVYMFAIHCEIKVLETMWYFFISFISGRILITPLVSSNSSYISCLSILSILSVPDDEVSLRTKFDM